MTGYFFMKEVKIIVGKHPDGYAAHPPGLKGVSVGRVILMKKRFRAWNPEK
jgi:hypothetical protein